MLSMAPTPFAMALAHFADLYESIWPDAEAHHEEIDGVLQYRVASPSKLRPHPGNHPKVLHHGQRQRDVVVLIHGITDSPYYMEAIGRRLHAEGFNVVLPLLRAHGRSEPWRSMRRLQHYDWVNDVDNLMALARGLGERISMGGFSTGGALTVHKIMRDPGEVTGGLYLFSAALDIGEWEQTILESAAGPFLGRLIDQQRWLAAKLKERYKMMRDVVEREAPTPRRPSPEWGIGDNPVKYGIFFNEAASELAEVIEEINDHYEEKEVLPFSDINHPLFLAHSNIDRRARFSGARRIYDNHPNDQRFFFTVEDVIHASVVLEEAVIDDPNHRLYSPANPLFDDMMQAMRKFTRMYVGED